MVRELKYNKFSDDEKELEVRQNVAVQVPSSSTVN